MNNRFLIVTPNCCKKSQKYASIILRYVNEPHKDNYYDNANYLCDKPKWCVRVFNTEQLISKKIYTELFEPKYCTFCGQSLPDIKLRKTTKRICRIIDGGYYCDSCKKRLNCCTCAPLEYMWEPNNNGEVDIPTIN